MPAETFQGRRVLSFETRRAAETATLIERFGGQATVAPALREVPLETNTAAAAFVEHLIEGRFDAVVFLTGVGARALADLAARGGARDAFAAALSRVKVIARGPKPVAVLRELNVPVWLIPPEPNTWQDLLDALDARIGAAEWSLAGARLAVQEYGVSNESLLDGLRRRGADVTPVPVYRWALPEDLGPLRAAVRTLAGGGAEVVLFTTAVQVAHLMEVAADLQLTGALRQGLARAVVASIGPTTSEALRQHDIQVDLEASHPKLGVLVREAAARAAGLPDAKRAGD